MARLRIYEGVRIYEGANGWYLAREDRHGSHRQPPSWQSSAWYDSYAAAAAARHRAEHEDADEDEEGD